MNTTQRLFVMSVLGGASILLLAGCATTGETRIGVVEDEPFYAPDAPPAPRDDVIIARPSPGHIWMPGRWAWHDRWAWEPGRWVLAPHPRAIWEPGTWEHRPHGWAWIGGRWR